MAAGVFDPWRAAFVDPGVSGRLGFLVDGEYFVAFGCSGWDERAMGGFRIRAVFCDVSAVAGAMARFQLGRASVLGRLLQCAYFAKCHLCEGPNGDGGVQMHV